MEWNFRGIKSQPLVTCKPINDPAMYPIYELMAEQGKWFIVHAGTAPYPNDFTSLDHLEKMLSDFPELKTILAHMAGSTTRARSICSTDTPTCSSIQP